MSRKLIQIIRTTFVPKVLKMYWPRALTLIEWIGLFWLKVASVRQSMVMSWDNTGSSSCSLHNWQGKNMRSLSSICHSIKPVYSSTILRWPLRHVECPSNGAREKHCRHTDDVAWEVGCVQARKQWHPAGTQLIWGKSWKAYPSDYTSITSLCWQDPTHGG